jgi:hypothetical protein
LNEKWGTTNWDRVVSMVYQSINNNNDTTNDNISTGTEERAKSVRSLSYVGPTPPTKAPWWKKVRVRFYLAAATFGFFVALFTTITLMNVGNNDADSYWYAQALRGKNR